MSHHGWNLRARNATWEHLRPLLIDDSNRFLRATFLGDISICSVLRVSTRFLFKFPLLPPSSFWHLYSQISCQVMENHFLSPSLNSITLMQCFYYFHTFSEILVILANMENTASVENLHKVRKSLRYQRLAGVSLTQGRSRYSLKNLTSTSLISREMKIKTYNEERVWEKREHHWWECKLMQYGGFSRN